ncbi:MAG: alpha/beta hydrolase [Spirochaetia bacterium]
MPKKKLFKWILIALPLLLVLGITYIVGGSYLEHRKLVEQEKEAYPAPGTLVEVNDNGDKLHVYAEGDGEETLVFMAGHGTASPVYDFKLLYDKLSKDNRIAVVERAGYGWSDITSSPRDIDTVLAETRKALQLAGENPPYVLFPHSMAGLEALYWAALHPEEVEAIVALDALVPGYIEHTEEEKSMSRMITFLARSGLMRSGPDIFESNFHAMKKGLLTEEEAEIAKTIFLRRVYTKNMWAEWRMLNSNSQTVSTQGKPEVPYYAFISAENEEAWWQDSITSYAEAIGGDYSILDGNHYIHLDHPDLIAQKSRELIEN